MQTQHKIPLCPRCGREAQAADAVFCAYCGAEMKQSSPVPQEAQKMLFEAEKQKDPKKKREILLKAQEQFPDCLEVAEALLFLGRLHERSTRKLDFSVIKCYLWHLYLTPEEFSEEKKQEMRWELFHHPLLERCMALYGDGDSYLRRYLKRLGCEFVALFLKGSNRYTGTMFGFRLDNRMSRVLAAPVAEMIGRIRSDGQLNAFERDMLASALYQAFLTETGSESRWVDDKLRQMNQPIPMQR